ncbi:unnamed protein product [Protopolystoma xenopodis]|uniref:Uncharacterized protein n=1 Tax=Protopolystoma xenopodis TaxID=117903 RepID=A0A448XKS4_9PLAT|nr:unnamed protein product [Protopolystoma xenopodis]
MKVLEIRSLQDLSEINFYAYHEEVRFFLSVMARYSPFHTFFTHWCHSCNELFPPTNATLLQWLFSSHFHMPMSTTSSSHLRHMHMSHWPSIEPPPSALESQFSHSHLTLFRPLLPATLCPQAGKYDRAAATIGSRLSGGQSLRRTREMDTFCSVTELPKLWPAQQGLDNPMSVFPVRIGRIYIGPGFRQPASHTRIILKHFVSCSNEFFSETFPTIWQQPWGTKRSLLDKTCSSEQLQPRANTGRGNAALFWSFFASSGQVSTSPG